LYIIDIEGVCFRTKACIG